MMRQWSNRRDDVVAVARAFDAERPLPYRGQKVGRIEQRRNAVLLLEPVESRGGEDHRVVQAFVELAHPGVDVAAQKTHRDVRVALAQLRFATQARRADDGA